MNFWFSVLRQTGRNLRQTWPTQFMTCLTVSLSVLIFSFFYLVYLNMLTAGDKVSDDLRLVVFLEDEPVPEMQEQLRNKITQFDPVQEIKFISKKEAYDRFAEQLGDNREVLTDMPTDFLPPSIEVIPFKNFRSLKQIKLFADYLSTIPGSQKVQYGQKWVERFYSFTQLLSIIVLLSGLLLFLTASFMVASTIRLTIFGRQEELGLLKLVGATNNYIRTPFLLEGLMQGFLGSFLGLTALYILFQWFIRHFSGAGFLDIISFSFFSPGIIATILLASIALCTIGSYTSMQKFLRV
jgi:cell division transport system permease protein